MKNNILLSLLLLVLVGCVSKPKLISNPTTGLTERILGNPFKLAASGAVKVSEAYGKSAMILEPKELIGWGVTLNLSERLFDGTPVDFEIRFNSRTRHLWLRVFPETENSTPFPIDSNAEWLRLIKNQGRVFIHRELPNVDIFTVLPNATLVDGVGEPIGLVLVLSKGELILNREFYYSVDYLGNSANSRPKVICSGQQSQVKMGGATSRQKLA